MSRLRKLFVLGATLTVLVTATYPAQARGFFDPLKESWQIAGDYVEDHGPDWVESGKETAKDLITAGKAKLPEVKEKVQEGLSSAADTVRKQAPVVAEKVKDAAATARPKVKEGLTAAGEKAKEGLVTAAEKAGDLRKSQENEFWRHFEDQTGVAVESRSELTGQTAKTICLALASAFTMLIPH